MSVLRRLAALLSDLRLAIVLLLLIAIASAIGTILPQGEAPDLYLERFNADPWLGFVNGDRMLQLQLDRIYSSGWFLLLLGWLGLALILCSWRRQWPALQAALRWIDYREPRQLSKLALAETLPSDDPNTSLNALGQSLQAQGWTVQEKDGRLAARRGVMGRVGPLLVHTGLVLLMLGAAWGALAGNRLERFLAPGRSLDLLDRSGTSQMTLTLDSFAIERDPAGRTEQFRSQLLLQSAGDARPLREEISVNHPLRYRGMTVYQADWSLATITVQLGKSPLLQLPLQTFPELGDQLWGLVLPTRPDGSEPVLLTTSSEAGPVQVFGEGGDLITNLRPGGTPADVNGLPLRVVEVMPASGLLLKRDPGVPLVYLGFAITLLGGGLSLVATRQLWAVSDLQHGKLHVAGLCNRNLSGFAQEFPTLLNKVAGSHG
ncbi:cytochrome c biogenesis protein ResB [Synechococcus sp. RS9916]|uniref:cytochrome c biogenesis protein ResB n=1 Tax=Synechococcus sp. RS9916 TaxID=221359 RepID=UPI0000E53514|nr:cytochrome c biogenesis protein ResB [Synechococcus sp. RS9916]EAU74760.1 putative c-type cytochrome biogenesis protein Ccs1 [Synechococcus sp. RS9916]